MARADVMHLTLRPAVDSDFEACRRTYFAEHGWIDERLNLARDGQEANFRRLWTASQVRIIQLEGTNVGWLQTVPRDEEYFLGTLVIDGAFQRRGVGTEVMKRVLEEGARRGQPVRLSVVKFNPARRLYERLGFQVTHEDEHKVYMTSTLDPTADVG
ncbi:MAG TPA: GNAT family N-acetyltransferase [Myxococcaceae bacterium]|nr:GNAT family N-acetyltransferase [Myxococcaceae bacterium]